MKSDLTYEEAHRIFDYDSRAGFLKWKVRTSIRVIIGQVAGTPAEDGRRYVKYLGRSYITSRIVWLMKTGSWPTSQIDHFNTNPSDDRFENLRQASHAQNCWNKAVRSDSTLGVKGVSLCKGKYQARLQANKQRIHLGTFETIEEAHAAYVEGAKKYHGDFFNDGIA